MIECRKCLLAASGEGDILKQVKECINKIAPKDRAEEKLYQSRLDLCKECEHLISGSCMKCGCYVELRAAYIKQKCPDSKNRKW